MASIFRLAFDQIHMRLVWLRFPQIPLEFFQKDFLLRLGNLVGKVVKVDFMIVVAMWEKLARVCRGGPPETFGLVCLYYGHSTIC